MTTLPNKQHEKNYLAKFSSRGDSTNTISSQRQYEFSQQVASPLEENFARYKQTWKPNTWWEATRYATTMHVTSLKSHKCSEHSVSITFGKYSAVITHYEKEKRSLHDAFISAKNNSFPSVLSPHRNRMMRRCRKYEYFSHQKRFDSTNNRK